MSRFLRRGFQRPARVVVDRGCVGRRRIGATAGPRIGREYDDLEATKDGEDSPEAEAKRLFEYSGRYTQSDVLLALAQASAAATCICAVSRRAFSASRRA